ncbi:ATP synthase subunit I [Maliponia aquimaris]|uniref:N-ATPase, AtpR subunit n=1 Tax=Maliponia aquimaris TaxID=1673631 RepID=A0A238L174_9RHOB|nr:ATP synthase subunit I [Maliponia aquimaris]SMX48844.1 N-ATPase, AtpR subunit [Maliponia aquimaris]
MIAVDWMGLGFGALAGAVASGLFFAGLAWGMRLALRSARPTQVLLISGALRIAALLGAGWLVAELGAWELAGFALAFLPIRFAALSIARRPAPRKAEPCS